MSILNYLIASKFERRPGASSTAVEALLETFPNLPQDYINLLREMNGGEGQVGEQPVELFSSEELTVQNEGMRVSEFAPGFLIFGTDCANEGFAFDTRAQPWVLGRIPLVGMSPKEFIPMGADMEEFLRAVYES